MKLIIRSKSQGHSAENRMDLVWKLLCFAAFTSPLRCYGLFSFGRFTGSFFKISSIAIVVLVTIKALTRDYRIYKDGVLSVILLIIFTDLLTVVYSNQQNMGLFPTYIVEHVILLFMYIALQNQRGSHENLINAYVTGAVIPISIGLYQWINVITTGRVSPLPLQSLVVATGTDNLWLYGNYRVVGTLLDPSYYGLYMATVLIICIGEIAVKRTSGKRRVLFVSIGVLSLVCIFISGSISSMLAAVAGVLFLLYNARLNLSKVVKYLVQAVLFVVIAVAVLQAFNYNPIEVLFTKLRIQATSTSVGALYGRADHYKEAVEDFLSSPIWGVGYGNIRLSSGHNSYLTILAQHGIIGFILHVTLTIIYTFTVNKQNRIYEGDSIIGRAVVFGMIVLLMGYDCLYKMDPTIVVLIICFNANERWKWARN